MKRFFYRTFLPLFFVGITFAGYHYLSSPRTNIEEASRNILDTLVTIKVSKNNSGKIETAFEKMREAELVGEIHTEESLLNRSISKETAPPKEVVRLIELSLEYAKLSNGDFDPTLKPLTSLWSTGIKDKTLPPQGKIDEALDRTGYEKFLNKGIDSNDLDNIDLGGILKGYAVDEAARYLTNNDVSDFLISTVSSTTAKGKKDGKKPWKIGIENPRKKNAKKDIIAIIEIGGDQASISTSGDYQRYFIKDKKRYTHIIDPRTGYPADNCMSVTVVTKDSAAFADALSTAIFVMGYPDGMAFVEKVPGLEALIVDVEGNIHLSKGMKEYIPKSEKTIY